MSRAGRFAVAAGALLAGCTDNNAGIDGTQSLKIQLVSPTDPGSIETRLGDEIRDITISVQALDAEGRADPSLTTKLQVYSQFLGTLSPGLGETPLATIDLEGGVATDKVVKLKQVFGPTTLWVDDGQSDAPTYATGTSPVLWFRDPFIRDLQTPRSETALDALTSSPLESKQITVDKSRHGANGKLLVTSVFSQGYTVTDADCSTNPCTAESYDHALVFSFSAPADQKGRLLQVGQTVLAFSGGVSEFNGLTEIGFPATVASDTLDLDAARLPAPVKFEQSWFQGISVPGGRINFERNEAAPILVEDGVVCDLDDDFATFKQWKLDPAGVGGDCSSNDNVLNVITTGISGIDPPMLVGKQLKKVVGVVRPVNIGSFNVWIIFPRTGDDIVMN